MNTWIYVDSNNRVLSANPNSMEGNTGWYPAPENLPSELCDSRGIALYNYIDSELITRSQSEIDGDYTPPPPTQPTDSQRIAQLEEELAAAKILLGLEA